MELQLASQSTAIDPVCGMSVEPAHAKGSHEHRGVTYHFCSTSCLKKFAMDPEKYLSGHREAMHHIAAPTTTSGTSTYTCPMHPEVISDRPGPCPKCGMALEPTAPRLDEQPDPELKSMQLRLWLSLACGVPVILLAMLDMLDGQPVSKAIGFKQSILVQWVLTTIVVFGCGWPFFERGWASLRQRSFNMFTLIALGVAAAYFYSVAAALDSLTGSHFFPHGFSGHGGMVELYFESAAAIVILVLVGQVMELRARQKTGDAIRALLQLAPKNARLILPDGREEEIAVELLQPTDRVRVRPGERIPVDGIIHEGSTAIDESMLTGEPFAVTKAAGDTVSAGTLNGNGSIVVETRQSGDGTMLARIVQMVAQAQRSRMPVQALVDRVANWFVPSVLISAAATFIIWAIFGGSEQRFTYGILNAVAVLIIACPCALGLATPMAVVVGMGRGASLGVLFRDAQMLERLGQIDTLVFDKTGTLTKGKPEVSNLESADGIDADELLRLAAAVERGSEHPLASAIVRAAEVKQVAIPAANDVQTIPGQGIRGRVGERTVLIGSASFLDQNRIESAASRRRLEDLREEGRSVVQVGIDGQYAGLIAVSDPLRPSTPAALEALKADGIRLVMLTGDSRTTANAVGRKIGIANVVAEVLPADKLDNVRRMQQEGRKVGMVGDGINDAPALAQADVGIAMGGGTDVAIESAGVTLIRSDLQAVVSARRLSLATMRTVRQNLWLAFLYNVLAVPIAAGILVPFGGGLIGPIWAAAAMSLSSLSVIGNSLRLRMIKL